MEIKYGNIEKDGFDYYIKDDLGGVHTDGVGYAPDGYFCGECTKESCEGCHASDSKEQDMDKATFKEELILEAEQISSNEDIEMSKNIFEGKLHIPCDNTWGVGRAVGSLEPFTLTIEKCEKIKMHHKEMDIDFEFDTKKIENINTIIINGHKFVRENSETDNI